MPSDHPLDRRAWMSILAKARPDEVAACWQSVAPKPAYQFLRRPEIGLTMLRGRIGGDGAPFNLGEMTVTRCSVRLEDGMVGHAWIAGRVPEQAEQAALLDALLQRPNDHASLAGELVKLARLQTDRRLVAAKKTAATKVDFFTLVRGED